jgi:hypothetical protein
MKQKKKNVTKKRGQKAQVGLSTLLKCSRHNTGEYTPLRGKQLIGAMADGHSLEAVADSMGVCVSTLYEWAKKYPEFAEALERAKGLRVFYLETQLLTAPDMRTVRDTIQALKEACPEEWDNN